MDLKETHETTEQKTAPIIDFDSLVSRCNDSRDKLLACCIATLSDVDLAGQFISHLINLPEPVDHNRVMFGVPVKNVMGLSAEQAQRAFNLNADEYRQIQDYLGLTAVNENAKARAAGIRE